MIIKRNKHGKMRWKHKLMGEIFIVFVEIEGRIRVQRENRMQFIQIQYSFDAFGRAKNILKFKEMHRTL